MSKKLETVTNKLEIISQYLQSQLTKEDIEDSKVILNVAKEISFKISKIQKSISKNQFNNFNQQTLNVCDEIINYINIETSQLSQTFSDEAKEETNEDYFEEEKIIEAIFNEINHKLAMAKGAKSVAFGHDIIHTVPNHSNHINSGDNSEFTTTIHGHSSQKNIENLTPIGCENCCDLKIPQQIEDMMTLLGLGFTAE